MKGKSIMKKLISIVLTLTLVFSLCIPAFAAMPDSTRFEDVSEVTGTFGGSFESVGQAIKDFFQSIIDFFRGLFVKTPKTVPEHPALPSVVQSVSFDYLSNFPMIYYGDSKGIRLYSPKSELIRMFGVADEVYTATNEYGTYEILAYYTGTADLTFFAVFIPNESGKVEMGNNFEQFYRDCKIAPQSDMFVSDLASIKAQDSWVTQMYTLSKKVVYYDSGVFEASYRECAGFFAYGSIDFMQYQIDDETALLGRAGASTADKEGYVLQDGKEGKNSLITQTWYRGTDKPMVSSCLLEYEPSVFICQPDTFDKDSKDPFAMHVTNHRMDIVGVPEFNEATKTAHTEYIKLALMKGYNKDVTTAESIANDVIKLIPTCYFFRIAGYGSYEGQLFELDKLLENHI